MISERLINSHGITLVVLVITIIVLSIIAGTATYIGLNNIQSSKDQIALAELEEVKHMVGEAYMLYLTTKNANYLAGTRISNISEVTSIANRIGVTLVTIPQNQYSQEESSYYRLNPEQLRTIGIEKSDDTYIVNYVTGEVINETKEATSENEPLYTYIRSIFNNNDITAF